MNDSRYSVERTPGARLAAERVHGKGRKVVQRPDQYENGVRYKTGRLETNAWCGEVIPMGLVGRPGVQKIERSYRAIAGEKISYRARKFYPTALTTGSSTPKPKSTFTQRREARKENPPASLRLCAFA